MPYPIVNLLESIHYISKISISSLYWCSGYELPCISKSRQHLLYLISFFISSFHFFLPHSVFLSFYFLFFVFFWGGGSDLRGRSPVAHRGINVCPSVYSSIHPSICPPPRPQISSLRPQHSPLRLQTALLGLMWLLRPHISPLRPDIVLLGALMQLSLASNMPFQAWHLSPLRQRGRMSLCFL